MHLELLTCSSEACNVECAEEDSEADEACSCSALPRRCSSCARCSSESASCCCMACRTPYMPYQTSFTTSSDTFMDNMLAWLRQRLHGFVVPG